MRTSFFCSVIVSFLSKLNCEINGNINHLYKVVSLKKVWHNIIHFISLYSTTGRQSFTSYFFTSCEIFKYASLSFWKFTMIMFKILCLFKYEIKSNHDKLSKDNKLLKLTRISRRRCGGRSSNSSLLKRFSKTGSQVFSAQLKHGRTAPGELGGTETPTSGVQPLR